MASNGNWLTRSYNFVDKDPEIDKFRTLFQQERKLFRETDLAVLAGLSVSTVKNMFGGKTARPQHATFAKMAAAMGFEYGLHREQAPDYATELPLAREQFKAHKARLKKLREREEARTKKRSRA
jgi:transcriptional regulator with XRE-family HTH domain